MKAKVMNAILPEIILINGQLVLEDEADRDNMVLHDGMTAEIDTLHSRVANTDDCEGIYFAPGLIELLTDNLEHHLEPCPGVSWPDKAKNLKQYPDVPVPVATAIDATLDRRRSQPAGSSNCDAGEF
mgnify:CR=1 FL=1